MHNASAIGAPIDRRDGRKKVTGTATYAAEFQVPGVVHAVLVQSTVTAGAVLAVETTEAAGMPGVLAIITADNALRLQPTPSEGQIVSAPLLQDKDILFNGQHVAVVVADSLERALAAAARVGVKYRQGEAVVSMDSALDQAWVPKHFRNGQRPPDSNRGEPDKAFDSAPVKHEATYTTPVEHHNPMEPHATIARWEKASEAGQSVDRLTVWHTTQGIGGAKNSMAKLFGIKPENVRIISPYLGGGFGCKGNTWPPATLAAMAAKLVGRPVKLVLSRQQMYTSNGYRPRTIQKLRLGATSDGALVAMRHDGFSQMSMPGLGEFSEPTGLATEMLYSCPNVGVTHRVVSVNQGLPTYMRAPGEAPGVYALECAMDELAEKLGMDPVELRLKNYADSDGHEQRPFSSKKLRECYLRAAEAFGWSKRSSTPGSMRDGDIRIGWGMATSTYPIHRMAASANVRLSADGGVLVRSATQDIGTGTYTVMTQVAAEELAMPVSSIRFELGDSEFPPAPVSGGSMTVASVGSAVQAACAAARERVFDLALADPRFAGLERGSLQFRAGAVTAPGRRVGFGDLLARARKTSLEVQSASKPGEEKKTHSLHAFGAQFAEVRVNPDIGEIRVSRYVGAFDAGRVMNAKTARSQLIGGITYGIGMALLEKTHVDPEIGRIVNANIAEYLVPVNADIPEIHTILVENDDRIANPIGAKGMGELPMVGVAAAVANAVYHATGRRVRDLPIRVEDVLA